MSKKDKAVPRLYSQTIPSSIKVSGEELTALLRIELREKIENNEIGEIEFEARVFTEGANGNYFRFYEEDLEEFCQSFESKPFLVNHNIREIDSRLGIIRESSLAGKWFIQTIVLTSRDGMLALTDGKIDRFSIGWKYDLAICSICNEDWYQCRHWPGQTYKTGKDQEETVCELYFTNPRGRETSAINDPAVDGTGLLAQLSEYKQEDIMSEDSNEVAATDEVEITEYSNERDVQWIELVLSSQPESVKAFVELQAQRLMSIGFSLTAEVIGELIRDAVSLMTSSVPVPPVPVPPVPTLGARPARISGHPPIVESQMVTGSDLAQNAWDWHLGVSDADSPPQYALDIRQLYMDITGDRGWHGRFNPLNAELAAADSSTLSGMVANAMNKVIVQIWNNYIQYRWFEAIVTLQPNDGSTQDMSWIQFGGIADLPTVAEGAAYTESTVADSKETDPFVKKGSYVGITLETIRRSEIARLRYVPRALALSCVRTRSAAIASIFTSNSGIGPTLDQDGKALFHADHGNLATTAFSWAAWKAARIECAKQSELGSGRRQSLWPKYCLVPFDLYDETLQVFGYGSGSEGQPQSSSGRAVNPYGEDRAGDPRPTPIAVPDFTDANNWAYIVDPNLAPVIQMSYAQDPSGRSHPMPELFSVASPTSGLVFTADTLPIKARDWFSYGASGYQGIGKRNVA